MKTILDWDKQLFLKINTEWTVPFLDWMMPIWRQNTFWMPFYVLCVIWLVYRFGLKIWPWLIVVAIMILFSDKLSSNVIKPLVARIRPCNTPELMPYVRQLLGHCSTTYSFTSSHAVNHFCIATFMYLTLRQHLGKMAWLLFVWAFSIVYGQVYVGIHYPLDVLSGAVLGIFIGYIFALIFNKRIGLPMKRLRNKKDISVSI